MLLLIISSTGKTHMAPVKQLASITSTLGYVTLMGAFLVLSFSEWESSMHEGQNRKMASKRH
jgi:hypothetical protein